MSQDNIDQSQLDFSSLSEAERERLIMFVRNEMDKDFMLDEGELSAANLSDLQASEIQRKLFKTLDRSNLGAEIIKFSTKGFIEFLMAVMKPAFSSSQKSKRSGDGI